MEKCNNCVEYASNLNFQILQLVHDDLIINKKVIISSWLESHRVKLIFAEIDYDLITFKTEYAEFIFDFFMRFTTSDVPNVICPTARKFLHSFKENKICAQLLALICTQLKNSITEFIIFKLDMKLDKKDQYEIFKTFSSILDINLSLILLEYSTELLYKEYVKDKHIKLLEESTLLSKTDINGVITFVSDSYCKLVGYESSELVGQKHSILKHPDMIQNIYEKLWETISSGEKWVGRIKNYSKTKKTLLFETTIIPERNHLNEIIGFVALKANITDTIAIRTDSLTGVTSRSSFNDELEKFIQNFYLVNDIFTIGILDIDHFKTVNDTYGHLVGDIILKEFAQIIRTYIRPTDVFARWGGEEFVIILAKTGMDESLNIFKRIKDAIQIFNFTSDISKTASFGVLEYSTNYKTTDEFLEEADKCLYHAKNSGRNRIGYLDNLTHKDLL